MTGYLAANLFDKNSLTALEIQVAGNDTKGTAWVEMDAWVSSGVRDGASLPAVGSGYTSVPNVKCVPGAAVWDFPENNGAWVSGQTVDNESYAVHWVGNVGFVFRATISGGASSSTTFGVSPLSANLDYGDIVNESNNNISWTYIGQTPRLTAVLNAETVSGITVEPDINRHGATGYIQGFFYNLNKRFICR